MVDPLRVFVTVAEQRNFSRAAELLHLSQPGVSLHIRKLEEEFGTVLMQRSPKQVKLTDAGELLYKRAKEMLMLHEAARQDILRLHDMVSGSLQIGASFTIGEYILPHVLARFAAHYPQVDAELTIGNTERIVQAVRSKQLQIGLVEGEVQDEQLRIIPYMKDEMILVVAPDHPLAALRSVHFEELGNQIWSLREPGSGTRAFSDRFFKDTGCTPLKTYVFNSSQGVKEAVIAGLGISILSRWVVRRELAHGELHEIIIQGIQQERNFSLLLPQENLSTRVLDAFMDMLLVQKTEKKDF